MTRPRFFVPEIVQTSEMDCGPASLKALLEGHGIPVSYGRLREACQTQVDGTSIDTLEQVAVQLGLDARQVMLPLDHLILREANALPALLVVKLPNGLPHFVVVWNTIGPFLQIMDPGKGRRWTTWTQFVPEIFIHTYAVPASRWNRWARSAGFLTPLKRRLSDLEISEQDTAAMVARAQQDETWRGLAALDAATRLGASLVRAQGIRPGAQATALIQRLVENAGADVPPNFWFVQETPNNMLAMRGPVLIAVRGVRAKQPARENETEPPLPPELAAALSEPPPRPEREIWNAMRQDGVTVVIVIVLALFMATLGVTLEAMLMVGMMEVGKRLTQTDQRVFATLAVLVFFALLLLLEMPLSAATQRVGRRIETRLRIAFLEKIPRLGDRYFFSRLTSDMANRAHMLVSLRNLPMLAVNFLRLTFQFILTSIAVLYLDPNHALLAIAFSMLFVALAYFTNPILQESSMRVNVLTGAISRFYLDAMLGLVPLKSHGAERALRREQEGLTTDWMRANLSAQRVGMLVQGASSLLYSLFAIVMVFAAAAQGGSSAELLLLFFWTLSLPVLAQGVVQSIQQYPDIRTMILRILEPLSAPEETTDAENGTPARAQNAQTAKGIAVKFENVLIQAGGQTILSDLNLQIAAGEHLAIVGPSGAGKSSFVGILLGWHKPVQGQVWIDDAAFDGARLKTLRQETAWVDPAVLLWNRSMLENLTYGATDREFALTALIEQADLYAVLNRLPEGLQTELGEGGGLVSGGEGQRVRLGRAMNRSQARLVILDEPFRGLDRDQRRELLKRARAYWHNATLLCVTHDIGETQTFDRVLVVEQGHIVEDAAPEILAAQSGSRYRALLESEQAVRQTMWNSTNWRQIRVAEGKVTVQDTDDARADA